MNLALHAAIGPVQRRHIERKASRQVKKLEVIRRKEHARRNALIARSDFKC